jgi:hypothetical protein
MRREIVEDLDARPIGEGQSIAGPARERRVFIGNGQ